MPAHRRRVPGPSGRAAPALLVVTVALVAGLVAASVGRSVLHDARSVAAEPVLAQVGEPVGATGVRDRAREVLRRWDARRVAAWAAGDAEALASLYVRGAPAGARDVAMLERWNARGVRVAGWTTQVLALEVVRGGPTVLVLRVTDRVVAAVAARGSRRAALPADAASRRTIELRRGERGVWRVVSVRAG